MSGLIYGLIGRKLGHSYSVPIHKMLGNDSYDLYELEPETLGSFLSREDLGGINITIPYKRDVMSYCDNISPTALAIGSVNTIVRRDGKLYAENTDAYGLEFMAKRVGISFTGKKVLIFGSGGASLTAQWTAKNSGAEEIVVVSRSGENNYGNLYRHVDSEIIINATPIGMYPGNGESPCSISGFPKCRGVLDMIYNPHRTKLVIEAEQLGIPCSDGLPMLAAQAKAAEEFFFGKTINESENERILTALRRETENIILIGMPGCGKSSVGEVLSKSCRREIIDIDAEIVRAAGCSIPEIFQKKGETFFRQMEHDAIAAAGRDRGRIIITGGGAVKTAENYSLLHQNGRIYHIERDIDSLPRDGRPLSTGADLQQMYQERLPLYKKFRDAVVQNNSTLENCAEKIWSDFCENTCN